MREISTSFRPDITVRFTAEEFEAVAHLFYAKAKGSQHHDVTAEILTIASRHDLEYRSDVHRVVAKNA